MNDNANLQINSSNLIRLPCKNSNQTFLDGFWQWVEILASGDYKKAVESLYWEREPWSPNDLEHRITTYFSTEDKKTFVPVIPNDRLIKAVNDTAEIEWNEGGGWGLAQIPVTNKPENSKDDDVLLMGLAVSFFVQKFADNYVLKLEIFHA